MLQVHDSAARWRSFFEETCANEISNFAAQWPEKTGFIQSFEDVQAWDPRFAELILNHPRKVIEDGVTVLTQLCAEAGHDVSPRLLVNQLPPDSKVELRVVGSERVEQFISSEVIVTKVSELKPRIYHAHFKCSCDYEIEIPQPNELELIEPLECPEGLGCGRKTKGANAVRIELIPEKSRLVDNQWIEIQELPENAQGGSNPARMQVLAEGDLAGIHSPGCLLYTSPSPRDGLLSRMPSSA